MTSPPVGHPDDRLLIAFNLSKLDQRKVALISEHLKSCKPCQRRLAALSAQRPVPLSPNSPLETGSRRTARLVWFGAAGAAVLGMVLGWAMGIFSGPTKSNPTTATNGSLSVPPPTSTALDRLPPSLAVAEPPKALTPPPVTASENQTVSKTEAAAQPAKLPEAPKSPTPVEHASSTLAAAGPSSSMPAATEKPHSELAVPSLTFFNGKDLTGWRGPAQAWHVENGSIVGSPPPGQKGAVLLSSRERYTDFDLMFRATLADGIGDCGVQFRSRIDEADNQHVAGPQCAIYGKDAPPEHRTGSLVMEPGDKIEKSPPLKRVASFVEPVENHYRIRCQGKHILIEVNGIKMVNGEFPSLPDEGVIAWRLDASRPPRKVTFSIIKFVDLTRLSARDASERPSLSDVELLKAEMKFESAMKKADETLLTHFDAELSRLKRTTRSQDREMRFVVEHEKDAFKEKGLVPWSRPMRKWLLQYGRELHEAQRTIGNSFDAAIERAEKNHNEPRKTALLAEAGQVLAPREVAAWQRVDKKGKVLRRTFYSDGTFADGETTSETAARFWSPPADDVLVLEFPDKEDAAHTDQQEFVLAPDGKTLTSQSKKGNIQVWKQADDQESGGGS
jgi:hypothetical protein